MKLRKKIISVLLAAVCAVSFCAGAMTVSAEGYSREMKYGDYLYYRQVDGNNDGTFDYVEISDCDESVAEIIIPNEIDGLPVRTIENFAFEDCTSLTSIDIPDNLTDIGLSYYPKSTLDYCTSLKSVNVSENNNNYSSIDGVLFDKAKMTLMRYPIAKKASKYLIPDGVTSINDYAFRDCTGLEAVEIPDSITSIGYYKFSGCTSLKSVKIPNSVTSIERYAFSGCTSLTSIDLPNSVTSIVNDVFSGCTSLASIEIPDSVTEIGYSAFSGCSSLASINVSENNKKYSSIDGALFNKDKTELIKYPVGKKEKKYSVPDSVTSIGWRAFYYCTNLTSIEIPDGVTEIESSTFYNCTSLTSIVIPNSVKSIDYSAFYNCTNLTSIEIPDSVTYIAPDGVTYMGDGPFSRCTNLTIYANSNSYAHSYAQAYNIEFVSLGEAAVTAPAVTTPPPLTSPPSSTSACGIATYVYQGQYKNLYYEQMRTDYGYYGNSNITIAGCDSSVTEVVIPDSIEDYIVDSIGDYAFSDCINLTNVKISGNVKSIGYYAFSGCTNLTDIDIPNSVTSIKDYAFRNCTNIVSIYIPNSVSSIGDRAFLGCENLIICGYNNSYAQQFAEEHNMNFYDLRNHKPYTDEMLYEDYLFYKKYDEKPDGIYEYIEITDCAALAEKVVIPSEIDGVPVKIIGKSAFEDCSKLTSIDIPDSVTSIGNFAFSYCTSLTSIDIPDSVTSIGSSAFYNCTSLTGIDIPDGVTSIGISAFDYCTSLVSIDIPDSVTSIADTEFSGCSSLTSINVSKNNENYCSIDGALLNKDKTKLIKYPMGKKESRYSLPSSVTSIRSGAFSGCTSLEAISILNSECEISNIPANVVVYGYKNSTAHIYCLKNGISFVELEKGDANGDSEITVADIVEMQKYLTKFKAVNKGIANQLDLNNDGKFNVFDWIILKRQLINAVK